MNKESISVIVPAYNEEESLKELHSRLSKVLVDLTDSWEIIFINDGSTDNTIQVLKELWQKDQRVKVINFRRNFGKSAVLQSGFKRSIGDYVITIDADLQDHPEEIPALLTQLNSGYDLVSGWKKKRNDPWGKVFWSRIFNGFLRLVSGLKIHDFNCGLKIYRRDVVRQVRVYGELHRFIPLLAHHYGFRVGELAVTHSQRRHGHSKYGSLRIIKGFLDLVTVILLTRYTKRPGHFFGSLGLLSFVAGFFIASYLTIIWFIGQGPIGNRPLLFLAILLMIIGIQLISLGLLGEMIVSQKSTDEDELLIKDIYDHQQ
jgi:glycosyltransferase involved in cell wall biosynthesis